MRESEKNRDKRLNSKSLQNHENHSGPSTQQPQNRLEEPEIEPEIIRANYSDKSEIFDEVPEEMPDNTRGSNVSIPEFSGVKGSNFKTWLERFNIVFASNNWADDRKASTLAAHLTKNAFHEYLNLPKEIRSDYASLVQALFDTIVRYILWRRPAPLRASSV